MQGMQLHFLQRQNLGNRGVKICPNLAQIWTNLANLGEIWEKFGRIWVKVTKIVANLIRFRQN